jgi:hypothetical protein
MPNPMNTTTAKLHQMTSTELDKARRAAVLLCSAEIAPYIADVTLSAKLCSLRDDLADETAERKKLAGQPAIVAT